MADLERTIAYTVQDQAFVAHEREMARFVTTSTQGLKNVQEEWEKTTVRQRDSLGRFVSAKKAATDFGTESAAAVKKVGDRVSETTGKVGLLARAGELLKGAFAFVSILTVLRTIQRAIVGTVRAAVELETAMVGVRKTTGLADEQLKVLERGILRLSARLGIGAANLAAYAETAGQLGIEGVENILAFTEAAAKLENVSDLSADSAASGLAKISSAFQLPITQAENLGSAINELSNTTAATAGDVVDGLRRIGASGVSLGITVEQAAALVALLVDMGVESRVAGTSLRNVFTIAQTKAGELAAVAGVTEQAFVEMLGRDPLGALQTYLAALGELPPRLQAVRIEETFGRENILTVQTLAGQTERLGEVLDTSLTSFRDGTSLSREFDAALDSTAKQWEIFTARVTAGAIALGQKFTPAIRDSLRWINSLTDSAEDLGNQVLALRTQMGNLDEVDNLITRYEELSGKTELTAEETAELEVVTRRLAAEYPGYIRQTNAAGEAVSLYADRLREATAAQRELARVQILRNLDDLASRYETATEQASNLRAEQERLNAVADSDEPRFESNTQTFRQNLFGDGNRAYAQDADQLAESLARVGGEASLAEGEARALTQQFGELFTEANGSFDRTGLIQQLVRSGKSMEEARSLANDLQFGYAALRAEVERPVSRVPVTEAVTEQVQTLSDQISALESEVKLLADAGVETDELASKRARLNELRKQYNRLLKGSDEGDDKDRRRVEALSEAHRELVEAARLAEGATDDVKAAMRDLFRAERELASLVGPDDELTAEARALIGVSEQAKQLVEERIEALKREIKEAEVRVSVERDLFAAMQRVRELGLTSPGDGVAPVLPIIPAGQEGILEPLEQEIERVQDAWERLRDALAGRIEAEGDPAGLMPLLDAFDDVRDDYDSAVATLRAERLKPDVDTEEVERLEREVERAGNRYEAVRALLIERLQVAVEVEGSDEMDDLEQALRLVLAGFESVDAAGVAVDENLKRKAERATAAAEQMGRLEKVLADYQQRLLEINTEEARGNTSPGQAERERAAAAREAQAALGELLDTLMAMGAAEPVLNAIREAIIEIKDEAGGAGTATEKWSKTLSDIGDYAGSIARLGREIGLFNDETAQAIESVADLAEGIGRVVANPGDVGGWLQTISGAVGVISSLFGGESAEERRARIELQREIQENYRALRENTEALLLQDQIGTQYTQEQIDILRDLLSQFASLELSGQTVDDLSPFDNFENDIEAFLESVQQVGDLFDQLIDLGVERELVEQFRDQYQALLESGLSPREALEQILEGPNGLLAALGNLADNIGGYAQTIGGAIAELSDGIEFLGLEGQEALDSFLGSLRDLDLSASLQAKLDEIASLDLSSQQGQDQLAEIIAEIFRLGPGGTGLSQDDLEALLRQLQSLGGDIADLSGVESGNSATQVQRTITEAQANEVVAGIRRIADLVSQIVDLMTGPQIGVEGPETADGPGSISTTKPFGGGGGAGRSADSAGDVSTDVLTRLLRDRSVYAGDRAASRENANLGVSGDATRRGALTVDASAIADAFLGHAEVRRSMLARQSESATDFGARARPSSEGQGGNQITINVGREQSIRVLVAEIARELSKSNLFRP